MFSSQATNSPSKLNVPPSRSQRNQPASRVQDIEFAAQISTALLEQVRQLQGELAARDEVLKSTNAEKAKLESDFEGLHNRLRSMDESEHRYKDENWNLETQTRDLMASAKEAADREHRLAQNLNTVLKEKSMTQKELDELKQAYGKLSEDHVAVKKHHDTELASVRRNLTTGEAEKGTLRRRVEELNSQNQELARAVASGRMKHDDAGASRDLEDDNLDITGDHSTPESSPPPSPTKGTPRHTMLESETLKSSLHHAHRMIQNLKGNIHREKTEKLELKRMLQEARDEVESRRTDPGMGAANSASKRKTKSTDKDQFKKPMKPNLLGAGRNSKSEVLSDADWEDHNGERSPGLRSRTPTGADRGVGAFPLSPGTETSDAFETANERETETDAFQTGAESFGGESSDAGTETEGGLKANRASNITLKPRNRDSYLSTASTSNDEEEEATQTMTPLQPQPQRFRLKSNRGGVFRKSRTGSDTGTFESPSSLKNSPASFASSSKAPPGQTLFAELGDMEGDSEEGDDGTPSKRSVMSQGTPGALRSVSARNVASPSIFMKPTMTDSSTMTEPWEPAANLAPKRDLGIVASGAAAGGAAIGAALVSHNFDADGRPKSIPQPDSPTLPPQGFAESIYSDGSTRPVSIHQVLDPSDTATEPMYEHLRSSLAREASRKRWTVSSIQSQDIEPVDVEHEPLPKQDERLPSVLVSKKASLPALSMSTIETQDISPVSPRSLQATDEAAGAVEPKTKSDEPKSGFLGSVFGWGKQPPSMQPNIAEDVTSQNADRSIDSKEKEEMPFRDVSGNAGPAPMAGAAGTAVGTAVGAGVSKETTHQMSDQGSQTIISSEEIENLLSKRKSPVGIVNTAGEKGPPGGQWRLSTGEITPQALRPQRSQESVGQGSVTRARAKMAEQGMIRDEATTLKTHKRPGSAGSSRSNSATHPPLPPDHKQAIAAAAQRVTSSDGLPAVPVATGTMGPPLVPASAYRVSNLPTARPRTPSQTRTPSQQLVPASPTSYTSRAGTTPRARGFTGRSGRSSPVHTRRSSVSSFASELDERFNIRTDGMPMGMEPGTDPRMIQAITQTMIGEFMWKYTRKAGRGDMSNNRHRRFFWVHPYTRTLYWSDQDPAQGGRAQLKAKSVAIEAVHVVTDDNPMPPGLHRKSLVIVTPGRNVKFTATTGQRHETWFNALSYLLLRTSPDAQNTRPVADDASQALTHDDIDEFNPGYGSSVRGRGPASLSSYNSRTTRNTAPSPSGHVSASMSSRRSLQPTASGALGYQSESRLGRGSIRRLSNYFNPGNSFRGSVSSRRSRTSIGGAGGQGSIYEASEVNDSAEDVREVIERQDREADRLENVRACCDGEFFS